MPLAGAVSRVSILYLRCSLRRGGVYGVEGDQGEVTFNSLFEMPRIVFSVASRCCCSCSFNSLFEMLDRGGWKIWHGGNFPFQFSI